MGGELFEQQACDRVGLLVEYPMRPVQDLESVLAADVAPAVSCPLLKQSGVTVAPHIHRGNGDFVSDAAHVGQRMARYQLSIAVRTPGSAIARASRLAAAGVCLSDCNIFDSTVSVLVVRIAWACQWRVTHIRLGADRIGSGLSEAIQRRSRSARDSQHTRTPYEGGSQRVRLHPCSNRERCEQYWLPERRL